MTERWRARPQTAGARISNPVSGGQCHLNHLTILRRFSWPNLAYMCTDSFHYQNVVVLFAVTFCGLLQDQWWLLRFDNIEPNSVKLTTTKSTSLLTGKGNQLKFHSQLYSLFFFQMVGCVNLCYYVNLSSQVIQYQEQSNLASPLFVKSK